MNDITTEGQTPQQVIESAISTQQTAAEPTAVSNQGTEPQTQPASPLLDMMLKDPETGQFVTRLLKTDVEDLKKGYVDSQNYILRLKKQEAAAKQALAQREAELSQMRIASATTPVQTQTQQQPSLTGLPPELEEYFGFPDENLKSKFVTWVQGNITPAVKEAIERADRAEKEVMAFKQQRQQEEQQRQLIELAHKVDDFATKHPDLFASTAVFQMANGDESHPEFAKTRNVNLLFSLMDQGYNEDEAVKIVQQAFGVSPKPTVSVNPQTVIDALGRSNARVVSPVQPVQPAKDITTLSPMDRANEFLNSPELMGLLERARLANEGKLTD